MKLNVGMLRLKLQHLIFYVIQSTRLKSFIMTATSGCGVYKYLCTKYCQGMQVGFKNTLECWTESAPFWRQIGVFYAFNEEHFLVLC